MKITVKYFANFREKAQKKWEDVEVLEDANLEDLISKLKEKYQFQGDMIVAKNHEFVDLKSKLEEGDEVAIFPPASGG